MKYISPNCKLYLSEAKQAEHCLEPHLKLLTQNVIMFVKMIILVSSSSSYSSRQKHVVLSSHKRLCFLLLHRSRGRCNIFPIVAIYFPLLKYTSYTFHCWNILHNYCCNILFIVEYIFIVGIYFSLLEYTSNNFHEIYFILIVAIYFSLLQYTQHSWNTLHIQRHETMSLLMKGRSLRPV